MSEVLDIEVDGEIEPLGNASPGDRPGRWGLPVAIALAGSLTMAVLVLVVLPAMTGSEDGAGPEQNPIAQPPSATVAAPAPTAPAVDSRIAAARSALAAWGKFVGDGDLERLKPWFAEDGPQYRQLAEEAQSLAQNSADAGYTVTTESELVVTEEGSEAVILATTTWSRPSETAQRFAWEVVLRRGGDGEWQLWTVREPKK